MTTTARPTPARDGRTVLTVQQPWADWIVDGWKPLENRTWQTSYRGRLWIHAGKTIDRGAWAWASKNFSPAFMDQLSAPTTPTTGAIIGHVDLCAIDCFSSSPWWTGSFAWTLANPARTTPEPKRGRLGLWIAGDSQPSPMP